MKKYNYMIMAFVALMLIVGAGCSRHWRDKESKGFDKDKNSEYSGYVDKLNLTTDQKGKLIDLQEKLFTDKESITDEIVKKEFELKKLYLAEKPDINAIDKAQDDVRALSDKKIPLFREFRNNARALLTEEQLKANPYAFMGPQFGGEFGYGKEREGWGCERDGKHEREGDNERGCGHNWRGDDDR